MATGVKGSDKRCYSREVCCFYFHFHPQEVTETTHSVWAAHWARRARHVE